MNLKNIIDRVEIALYRYFEVDFNFFSIDKTNLKNLTIFFEFLYAFWPLKLNWNLTWIENSMKIMIERKTGKCDFINFSIYNKYWKSGDMKYKMLFKKFIWAIRFLLYIIVTML